MAALAPATTEEVAQTLTVHGKLALDWERRKQEAAMASIGAKTMPSLAHLQSAAQMVARCAEVQRLDHEAFFLGLELFDGFITMKAAATADSSTQTRPPSLKFCTLACLTCVQLASKMILLRKRMGPARTSRYAQRLLGLPISYKDITDIEFEILKTIDFRMVPSPLLILRNFLEATVFNLKDTELASVSAIAQESIEDIARKVLVLTYHENEALLRALSNADIQLSIILRTTGVIALAFYLFDTVLSDTINRTLARMTHYTEETYVEFAAAVLQATDLTSTIS
ncbi:hypothetical protein PTSG_03831 [Salpingoeca rosetta]|uniref:Uncharacterized protein n=1 Tax=Salpingoeca rosetta (strain ATCC 50818 / BSB-021) TaxID=946362 RepID=F2U5I4_SALR5|nr:uncharacterized protein PTSG_03831 [Salpingoeca rosetta]EGD83200.1 hypothetical protein PTSG_03831 [Salpingoeca rosetta]|eukprot:XP_004995564.1 hypothetical protein PTSG_03831 [Salpingoeca rosetta]